MSHIHFSAIPSVSRPSARIHGPALGCVVDGCPPGIPLEVEDIQAELDGAGRGSRATRRSGASRTR